jgi:hypothetical protein
LAQSVSSGARSSVGSSTFLSRCAMRGVEGAVTRRLGVVESKARQAAARSLCAETR